MPVFKVADRVKIQQLGPIVERYRKAQYLRKMFLAYSMPNRSSIPREVGCWFQSRLRKAKHSSERTYRFPPRPWETTFPFDAIYLIQHVFDHRGEKRKVSICGRNMHQIWTDGKSIVSYRSPRWYDTTTFRTGVSCPCILHGLLRRNAS